MNSPQVKVQTSRKKSVCGSKNPPTCVHHGQGIGHDAHRAIRHTIQKDRYQHRHVPVRNALKHYESEDLAAVIMQVVDSYPEVSSAKMKAAILLAARVHSTDTRANRGNHERTPYIEHPLRNTLRAMRYGCRDEGTLLACVLHDVVEDHPFDIATAYAKKEAGCEAEARAISLDYINERFGSKTHDIVKGMTNPLNEDKFIPVDEKNIVYRDHVEEAIEDPGTAVGKFVDFKDNGLSLHHTTGMNPVGVYKRATKYLLVIPVFQRRFKAAYTENDLPISRESISSILNDLDRGEKYLLDLQAKNQPTH